MTTLKFYSKIGKKLIKLNKDLGKTILKDSIIKFTSTPIGLYIQIKTNNGFIRFYDKDSEIKNDGSARFLFMDIVDSIVDETIELDVEDGMAIFNFLPVFEFEDDVEDVQVIGNVTNITKEQSKKLFSILKKIKPNLKKSIFDESTEALLEIKNDKIKIITVDPLKYNKEELEIVDISQNDSLYLNKQNIKILETFFSKNYFEIIFGSDVLIRNSDFEYILEKKNLNMSLFYPTFKK